MNDDNAGRGGQPDVGLSKFESRTRALLEESAANLPGHIVSRLTQARHRALEEARAPQAPLALLRAFLARHALAPAGGAVAVAVLAVVLVVGRPVVQQVQGLARGDSVAALEDIELLADSDALDMANGTDPEFYEWALAEQGDAAGDGQAVLGS
jgi:hypothetical protein